MITTPITATANQASSPKGPERGAAASSQAEGVLLGMTAATEPSAAEQAAAEAAGQPTADTVEVSPNAAALAPPGTEEEQDQTPNAQEEYAERMKSIIEEAQGRATAVTFQVFNEGGEVVVKIVNKESGDVLRQIPSEEMQQLREKLQDMRGILIQEVS